jgi:putative salt-induced outer membrane protein
MLKPIWLFMIISLPAWAQNSEDSGMAAVAKAVAVDQAGLENSLLDDQGLHNDSELGFVQSQGNSDAQTTNFRQMNFFKWDYNKIKGVYQLLRSESRGVESARRWSGGAIYERDISEVFGAYVHQSYESNIYAGFNLRSNSEVGMRFSHLRRKTTTWFTYVGFRYMSEKRVDAPENHSDLGHVYVELNSIWDPAISTQIWAEYLPNFSHSKQYYFNYEASLSAALNRVFSLKSAYRVEYANVPAPKATHQRDSLLTTSLVAKF